MAVSISLTITQNSQSVANNTSNVTVKVNISWTYGSWNHESPAPSGWLKIDGTTYDFSSTFNPNRTSSGSQTLFTKTVNVSHASTGAKTLSCSASFTSGVSSGTVTTSASKVLTTIPRKSSLSASNGTLGTSLKLTVTKQASSFTHTITYKCGTASGTVCTKSSATTVAWNTSNGNTVALSSQNTTGTKVSVKFTITTYSGSTSVGSNTKTITMAIPLGTVKPTCSLTVTDSTGYASTYGGYIKGVSKFKVTVTPTLAYGSAISKYSTTANSGTYTSSSFTTGVLTSYGNLTVSAKITDKRGASGTASKTLTVLNYAPPTITFLNVHRCNKDGSENNQGSYVRVNFGGTVTSLSNKNTATYKLQYKKSSNSSYTTVTFSDYSNTWSVPDAEYIFYADTGSSYDVRLLVTDNFSTCSKATSASTGYTLMHWMNTGMAMAIGKVSEISGVLDVGLKTRFFGGILHPTLEPNTDLNDVRTPNTYVGDNITTYKYLNCPISNGTFTLDVRGAGPAGQIHQVFTQCNKNNPRRYERFYYQSSWGSWICTYDNGT